MPYLPTLNRNHARTSATTGQANIERAVASLASVLLAALLAVGISVVVPDHARAAGGGYVKKCGGSTIFLNEKEQKTFVLHNRIRREHSLKPFCVHPALEKAARAHSKDMIERDYFSHDTMGGGTFDERLKSFGYTPEGYSFYLVGENIAYGSGSYGEPDSIMSRWMKSDGHRHNILNPKFRQIGIGTYSGEYKGLNGVSMYTADFGVRRR